LSNFINHDYHIHTFLSSCSKDPAQTPDAILEYAIRNDFDSVCLTDHLWDRAVPGASRWYEPLDLDNLRKSLPLPKNDKVKVFLGCETEFCGGKKLGLSRENFEQLDFVLIPINHMHMIGFVRPTNVVSIDQMIQLIPQRLEELLALDLP
jgi:histidinol phosphatase-like PHP family hydrolase